MRLFVSFFLCKDTLRPFETNKLITESAHMSTTDKNPLPQAEPQDDGSDYNAEIVTRSAPRWAWDIIDNVASPDQNYTDAMGAVILACELADDEPIGRHDPRLQAQ